MQPLLISLIKGLLRPYAPIILSASFVGFFVFAAILVRYRHRDLARKTFVTTVLVLLAVPLLVGVKFAPFFPYLLYSPSAPTEWTSQEIRVVTEDGTELLYDARAAPPMTGPVLNNLANQMVSTCDRDDARQLGGYLLANAREYREEVTDDSTDVVEWVQFPRHNLDYQWSAAQLEGKSRFTAIRIYRLHVTPTAEDGAVKEYDEQLVYEVRDTDSTDTETDGADTDGAGTDTETDGSEAGTATENVAVTADEADRQCS